ncbi:MAG: hypothetical protein IJV02_03495 [Candidatus Methanomethylophilaceae archaeon]|nr:hypothetical protein [Candidatus Methanomethylophilaceae archaeon]
MKDKEDMSKEELDELNVKRAKGALLSAASSLMYESGRGLYTAADLCEQDSGEDIMLRAMSLNQRLVKDALDSAYANDLTPGKRREVICSVADVTSNLMLAMGVTGEKRFDDEVGRTIDKLKKIAAMTRPDAEAHEESAQEDVTESGLDIETGELTDEIGDIKESEESE